MMSISQWLKYRRVPRTCVLCAQYHPGNDAVCLKCHEFFTPFTSFCTYCAYPLPVGNFQICGECIKTKPYFDETIAPYPFEEPLRTLLHELKYHQGLYLVSFLANLIIKHLPSHALQTECLIPVPMHRKRLQMRGFNQAAELTKAISRVLHIPYQLNACKKTTHTLPQANLNAAQRQINLSNAFQTKLSHQYQHVTLIDDLMTTGSTANELAKTLKEKGVNHVSVWCCARVARDHVLSTTNFKRR